MAKIGVVTCTVNNCPFHHLGPVAAVYKFDRNGKWWTREFADGHPIVTPNQVEQLLSTGRTYLSKPPHGDAFKQEEWIAP